MQMNVRRGVRWSASRAYLDPARRRPNLHVVTGADVDTVLLDDGRASGVRVRVAGQTLEIRAAREVILSAGAIGSPVILQRSGVGPASVLRDAGVPLRQSLPGVGENLQDHLEVYLQYRCTQPITLNGRLSWHGKAAIALRWLLSRSGLGATNHFEACGFIRSRSGVGWPDVQFHFLPAAIRYDGRAALDGHGFQLHVGANRPKSRGYVRIASAGLEASPLIRFNYLLAAEDIVDWRACLRLSREIVAQPALDAYRGEEIQPGVGMQSDAELDAWVRGNVESAYHPCGTCRMGGAADPMAVLDSQCRVRGLSGLRVVDASAFPAITNGNTNAPTIMLAERAADMILGRALLPPEDLPIWEALPAEPAAARGGPPSGPAALDAFPAGRSGVKLPP